MDREGSVRWSQEPATDRYSEVAETPREKPTRGDGPVWWRAAG